MRARVPLPGERGFSQKGSFFAFPLYIQRGSGAGPFFVHLLRPFFPIRQIYHHMMAVWPDPFINPVPSRQPWRDRRRLGIRSSFCQPVKAVNRKSAALTVGRRLRFWRRRLSKRVGPRLIAANPSDLGFFPHCLRFTKHQDSRPRLVPPPMYAHCIAAMLLRQLNGGIDMQCMSPALNGASGCRIFSTVVSVSVNGIC